MKRCMLEIFIVCISVLFISGIQKSHAQFTTTDFFDPNITNITPPPDTYIKGKSPIPFLEIEYEFRYTSQQGISKLAIEFLLYEQSTNNLISTKRTTIGELSACALIKYCTYNGTYNFSLETLPLPAKHYYVKMIIDPDDRIEESDEKNNSAISDNYFIRHVILSGLLLFNKVETFLDTASLALLWFPGTCPSGTNHLITSATGTWPSSWGIISLSHTSLCTEAMTNADGYSQDLKVLKGATLIGDMNTTVKGLDVLLKNVELDPNGGNYTQALVELPDSVTVHEDNAGEPVPRGERFILFTNSGRFESSLNEIILTMTAYQWLHSYGLPFWIYFKEIAFKLDSLSAGIEVAAFEIRYVHEYRFKELEPNDFRISRGFPSNDVLFLAGEISSNIILNGDGLQGGFKFYGWGDTGFPPFTQNPYTCFPRGQIRASGFDISVDNGEIKPTNIGQINYLMKCKRKCPGAVCGDLVLPKLYHIKADCGLTSEGAFGGAFNQLGNTTEWGRFSSGKPTFKRNDGDKAGILLVPGFIMPDTRASLTTPPEIDVTQVLLGSRDFLDKDRPGELYPLHYGGKEADHGDGFFAGLTMGPQYLYGGVDPGISELLADDMFVLFNGNTSYDSFSVTEYTKYVLRPDGLTGVFNTTFSGPITVYGYELNLYRFAFRQVMNVLDNKTLIDGNLDLPYPAGLHIEFASLNLTCSGDLAEGEIQTEPCDGVDNDDDGFIDEGCGEALDYWNMPVVYSGMAFDDLDGCGSGIEDCPDASCRQLKLISQNQVNGIEANPTFSAFYSNQGTVSQQKMTSPVETVMDKPSENSEPGFSFQISSAYINQLSDYTSPPVPGFTTLTGLADVPLFDDLDLFGHFENDTVDPNGYVNPTQYDLYMFNKESTPDNDYNGVPDLGYSNNVEGYRNELNDPEVSNPHPIAEYHWPKPGIIDLSYRLIYQRSQSGADGYGPQFLGIKKTKRIPDTSDPVLTVSSVPDYINPERTKLSFGASADIAALESFHVNLTSLTGELNSFLLNQLGISFNLEGHLQDMLDASELMHDVAGGDITNLFEDALDTAFDPLNATFSNLSDHSQTLSNAPFQLTSQLQNAVNEGITQMETQLNGVLKELMEALYNKYAPFISYTPEAISSAALPGTPSPDDLAVYQEEVEKLLSALDEFVQTLQQIQMYVTSIRDTVDDVYNTVNSVVAPAQNALTQIQTSLATLSSFTSSNPSINPLLGKIEEAKDYVEQVRDAVEALDLGYIGSIFQNAASAVGANIDTSLLQDAEQFFDDLLEEMDRLIQNAESNMNSLFNTAGLGNIFNDVNDLLFDPTNGIEAHINNVEGLMQEVHDILIIDTDGISPEDGGYVGMIEYSLGALLGPFQALQLLLNSPLNTIPASLTDWSDLVFEGQSALDAMATSALEELKEDSNNPVSLQDLAQDLWISLGGAPAFEPLFVNGYMAFIEAPINDAKTGFMPKLDELTNEVLLFLPTASSEDLQHLIMSSILNGDPIQNLNSIFHGQMSYLTDFMDDVSSQVTDKINALINATIEALAEGVNNQLGSIVSQIGSAGWGLQAAKIDGYGIVSQDELERLHIEAAFTFDGDPDPTTYSAALDVTSWNAENGKGACVEDGTGNIDVVISAQNISADMLGISIGLKQVALGFTLKEVVPMGVFGYVYTSGELNFEAFILKDLGLEAGVGAYENYLGATGSGRFESYSIPKAAFYFGRTCDFNVIRRLDAEVAEFIGERVPFTGVYVRGSVEVPIYNLGCFFRVGVGADIGVWFLVEPSPATYGGLLGGSAFGKILCIASLKGKITVMGQKSGSEYRFSGSGWAAAGIGFCEPEDWHSVADSRKDSWCGTGDASFGATYIGSWSIDGPNTSCCH